VSPSGSRRTAVRIQTTNIVPLADPAQHYQFFHRASSRANGDRVAAVRGAENSPKHWCDEHKRSSAQGRREIVSSLSVELSSFQDSSKLEICSVGELFGWKDGDLTRRGLPDRSRTIGDVCFRVKTIDASHEALTCIKPLLFLC